MAEVFEGQWVLDPNAVELSVLKADRYGPRILYGFYDEEGVLHIPRYNSYPPTLTGAGLAKFRKLTEDIWQCIHCGRWAKGSGYCPICGAEGMYKEP